MRDAPEGIEADWQQVPRGRRGAIETAIKQHRWPVYMWGEAGRGKTSTMACLHRAWLGRSVWFRLSTFVELIQLARRSGAVMLPGAQREVSEAHIWRTRVDDPSLLCIDDIGLRGATDSYYAITYELIDRRGTKPAIYTSNLSPERLNATLDGRVASRLLRGMELQVEGRDQRLAQGVRVVTD